MGAEAAGRWLWGAPAVWNSRQTMGPRTRMFAGAGQNVRSRGTFVATVDITQSGGMASFDIQTRPGNVISEVHIYASQSTPTTIAPGRYGNTTDYAVSSGVTRHQQDIYVGTGPFRAIVHAVICR